MDAKTIKNVFFDEESGNDIEYINNIVKTINNNAFAIIVIFFIITFYFPFFLGL